MCRTCIDNNGQYFFFGFNLQKAIANTFYTSQLNDVTKSKVIFGMQLYVQDNQNNELSYSEVIK